MQASKLLHPGSTAMVFGFPAAANLAGYQSGCSRLRQGTTLTRDTVDAHECRSHCYLSQVPIESGENWAAGEAGAGGDGGVRKLILRHDVEGVLGTIYLDLHRSPYNPALNNSEQSC